MTVHDLLADLQRRGLKAITDGSDIVIRGPRGALTPDLIASIRAHKPELVAALQAFVQFAPPANRQAEDPEFAAALGQLEWEIETGHISQVPVVVRGQPIGLIIGIEELARLLVRGRPGRR